MNTPSRGRKQCPGCKNYVGVRTTHCQCGHEFKNGRPMLATKRPIDGDENTPSRGHKLCPSCKKYVGVRTAQCQCGYEFKNSKPAIPVKTVTVAPAAVQAAPVHATDDERLSDKEIVQLNDQYRKSKTESSPAAAPAVPPAPVQAAAPAVPPAPAAPRQIPNFEGSSGNRRKQCPECKNYVAPRTAQCECGHDFSNDRKEKQVRNLPPLPKERVASRSGIWTPSGSPPAKLTGTSEEEVCEWAEKVFAYGRQEGKNYLVQALIYWIRDFYSIDVGSDGKMGCPEYRTVRSHLLNNYD